MAFAVKAHQIRCTNCGFQGKAEVMGGGCGTMAAGAVLVVLGLGGAVAVGVWAVVLALIGLVVGLAGLFGEAKQRCPRCKWEHPVRLD